MQGSGGKACEHLPMSAALKTTHETARATPRNMCRVLAKNFRRKHLKLHNPPASIIPDGPISDAADNSVCQVWGLAPKSHVRGNDATHIKPYWL